MEKNNKFPIILNNRRGIWKLSYCKNINSIFCVVGENGAGKTRLLNSILKRDEKYIVLPKKNNIETNEYSFVKYSTSMEMVDSKGYPSKNFDISTSYFLSMMNLVSLNREDSIKQVKVVLDFYENKNNTNGVWKNLIELSNKELSFKLTENGEAIKKYKKSYFSGQILEKYLKKFLDNFKNEIKSQSDIKLLKDIEEVLIIKFLSIFMAEIIELTDDNDSGDNVKQNLLELFQKFEEKIFRQKNGYKRKLKFILKNENPIDVESKINSLETFFCNFINFRKRFKKIYKFTNYSDVNALKIIVNMICNNDKNDSITKEVFSVLEFEWNGLSSGELALLNLLGRLNSINNQLQDNVILLIDEVDLGMHPEWQRKWVKDVLPIIGEILLKKNRSVHIILTTHSPIILSDFMEEDVIYLSNKGNKDIEAIVLDYKTFGQNIYSLFKNSFFLQDNKGGFAHDLIKELLNIFANNTKFKFIEEQDSFINFCKNYKIDYNDSSVDVKLIFENLINMIGEDIIRMYLKKQLYNSCWKRDE